MSLFTAVEMAPRDPILGLNEQFNADTNPHKVNLGVGVYYDDDGKLPLLQCVQAAEKQMMEAPKARGVRGEVGGRNPPTFWDDPRVSDGAGIALIVAGAAGVVVSGFRLRPVLPRPVVLSKCEHPAPPERPGGSPESWSAIRRSNAAETQPTDSS